MQTKKLKFIKTRLVVPQSDMSPDYNEYVFKDVDTGGEVRFKETKLLSYAMGLLEKSKNGVLVKFDGFPLEIVGNDLRYFILGGNAVIRHDRFTGCYFNLSKGEEITIDKINKINSKNDLRMAGVLPVKNIKSSLNGKIRMINRYTELFRKNIINFDKYKELMQSVT